MINNGAMEDQSQRRNQQSDSKNQFDRTERTTPPRPATAAMTYLCVGDGHSELPWSNVAPVSTPRQRKGLPSIRLCCSPRGGLAESCKLGSARSLCGLDLDGKPYGSDVPPPHAGYLLQNLPLAQSSRKHHVTGRRQIHRRHYWAEFPACVRSTNRHRETLAVRTNGGPHWTIMDFSVSRRTFLGGTTTAGLGFAFAGAGSLEAFARPSPRPSAPQSGYGPLIPDPNGLMALPEGFSYKIVAQTGVTPVRGGGSFPSDPDGMASVPVARQRRRLDPDLQPRDRWR